VSGPQAHPLRRAIDAVGRFLPNGWRDFWLQFAIFWSFYVAYEASRTLASPDRYVAIRNALDVVRAQQVLGMDVDRSVQAWAVDAPGFVIAIANWTYFNCQFTITYALLLFIYFRRNHAFYFIRNALLATSFAALIGYLMLPTAPPRMLGGLGYVDTLNQTSVNHSSGIVQWFANPYAAMPSLHIGWASWCAFGMWPLMRRRWTRAAVLLYPALTLFCIVVTANHYWLDGLGGLVTLGVAFVVGNWLHRTNQLRLDRKFTAARAVHPSG